MEYRRFGNDVVIRMDRGEEILAQLKTVAEKEKIRLASVSALGAAGDFTVGIFDLEKKEYNAISRQGSFEIVSLLGTVNTMDGAFYTHLHMSVSGPDGQVIGGHLNRAVVSITCEMTLRVIDGTVDRARDEAIGVNLFRF